MCLLKYFATKRSTYFMLRWTEEVSVYVAYIRGFSRICEHMQVSGLPFSMQSTFFHASTTIALTIVCMDVNVCVFIVYKINRDDEGALSLLHMRPFQALYGTKNLMFLVLSHRPPSNTSADTQIPYSTCHSAADIRKERRHQNDTCFLYRRPSPSYHLLFMRAILL